MDPDSKIEKKKNAIDYKVASDVLAIIIHIKRVIKIIKPTSLKQTILINLNPI